MNVREFYAFMCEKLPEELRLDGDEDGISCCPDPEREVKNVLIALDATGAVVDEAAEEGYDVILTHHPMLFGGIGAVTAGEYRSDKLIKLKKNGITTMAFHTRLDAADGGVNDIFAKLLGLRDIEKFGEKNIGRIGRTERPLTAEELALLVKNALGAPFAEYSDGGKLIKRVAVVGGSATSQLEYAEAAGADALIGGEIKYHTLTDSNDFGMTLVAAGHFYTENPVCARLMELTAEAGAIPTITFSNRNGSV